MTRKSGAPLLYGEETEPLNIRVPISKKEEIKDKFYEVLKTYERVGSNPEPEKKKKRKPAVAKKAKSVNLPKEPAKEAPIPPIQEIIAETPLNEHKKANFVTLKTAPLGAKHVKPNFLTFEGEFITSFYLGNGNFEVRQYKNFKMANDHWEEMTEKLKK